MIIHLRNALHRKVGQRLNTVSFSPFKKSVRQILSSLFLQMENTGVIEQMPKGGANGFECRRAWLQTPHSLQTPALPEEKCLQFQANF